MLKVKMTKHGRGVFATNKISRGDIVETCPVILIPVPKKLKKTSPNQAVATQLSRYIFGWSHSLNALALGLGSLYNHANYGVANMRVFPDYQDETIVFLAERDIKRGEELRFDYRYEMNLPDHLEVEKNIEETKVKETSHRFESLKRSIAGNIEVLKR